MERDPSRVGVLKELRSFHTLGWEPCGRPKKGKCHMISTKNQAEADALDCVVFESLNLVPREISWNCNWCKPKLDKGTMHMPKIGERARLWRRWNFLCEGTRLREELERVTLKGLICSDTIKMYLSNTIIHFILLSKTRIRSFQQLGLRNVSG